MTREHHHFAQSLRPGSSGRVRLRGNREFDFVCMRDAVMLDNVVRSPKKVFLELVEEVLEVD